MMKARSWRAPKWEATAWRVTRHCVILFAVSGAIALFSQESGQRVSASGPKSPPPASAYAGDAACASCHEKEAKAYFKTPHYLDSSAASAKTILGDFTPGKNVLRTPNPDLIFAMIAANDGFFQSAVNIRDPQNLTGEAQKFDIVVGSGRHGQTYLYWKGDQLFELPVSYWTWTHTWINSPGYPDGGVHFNRPIVPRCLECHATRFDWNPPPDNRYRPDSMVLGIGCERCHGPGREHVERERGANPPVAGSADIAIVNPAHLARDRQLDLCSLCHAGPVEPLAPPLSYQVGAVITDYLKITAPPADKPVDVHGNQVGALKQSKCYLSGKLTCSTCHNVHRTQESADSFSSDCLTCHDVQACGGFKQMGESLRGKCVECHMPIGKSQALTSESRGALLQAQLRTHRIAIYPGTTAK
jgi:hypothetical protein